MQELRALSNNIQLSWSTSNQAVEADAKRKERDEYDRAVKRAEDVRAMEESKRRTFRDTAVGQAWEETGGVAPFLLGAASGFVQRGINPSVSHGRVMGIGAGGGAAASNLPLGADAYLVPPVENPDKRAAEGYARELPPTHPRKQEWLDYAASPRLPALNPARSEAEKALYDAENYGLGAVKRNLFGGVEGLVGSEIGYGAFHLPARFFNALGRGARDWMTSRSSPTGAAPSMPGVAVDDIPLANALSGAPTAVRASSGPTQPASSAGTGGQPQGRLHAPEASPNRQTSSEPPLPPGIRLDKNGLPYDAWTGHKIKKRYFEGRDE